jgi:hypothetical protein
VPCATCWAVAAPTGGLSERELRLLFVGVGDFLRYGLKTSTRGFAPIPRGRVMVVAGSGGRVLGGSYEINLCSTKSELWAYPRAIRDNPPIHIVVSPLEPLVFANIILTVDQLSKLFYEVVFRFSQSINYLGHLNSRTIGLNVLGCVNECFATQGILALRASELHRHPPLQWIH